MDISCKRCGAPTPAAHVNVSDLVAKCGSCNAVFDIRDQIERPTEPRPAVPMPVGMRVVRGEPDTGGDAGPYRSAAGGARDVLLEWRWYRRKYLFVVAFTAAWWAILLVFYTMSTAGGAPWLFFVIPVIHVVVGLVLGYISLALLKNSTRVAIENDALRVSHYPLRWPGARSLPVRDIEQLYCDEGVAYTVNDRPVPGFNLLAQMKGGDEIKLVKNLPEAAQALYIEQTLEKALGITDRPVPGELPR